MVHCLCFGWRMDSWKKMQNQKLKPSSSAEPARDLPESSQTVQRSNNRCQVFRYRELALGTNNFSLESMIGRGGFGIVYKGMIGSGQDVAVKMLDNSGFQGDKEFLVEVLMLSVLRHENLVKLIGYCAEGDQRLIVYEYMPLGSLEDHLHDLSDDKKPLDWMTRMDIAVGAAKGLQYLHTGTANPVIYRDLKSSNILLDNEYKPKLSDFGLAKLGPTGDMTHVSTTVMGTHGYCDPEYGLSGKLTFKSDIYSFGVVLLELITGHQALMDSSLNVGPSRFLVHWARTLFKEKQIHEIVDPRLEIGPDVEKSMMRALAVAFWCVSDDANSRPTITELVNALDYIVESIVRIQKKKKFDGVEGGIELETMTRTVSSPRQITRMMTIKEEEEEGEEANAHLERKRAVAEAKAWAESWRGFKSQSSEALKPTLSMC